MPFPSASALRGVPADNSVGNARQRIHGQVSQHTSPCSRSNNPVWRRVAADNSRHILAKAEAVSFAQITPFGRHKSNRPNSGGRFIESRQPFRLPACFISSVRLCRGDLWSSVREIPHIVYAISAATITWPLLSPEIS